MRGQRHAPAALYPPGRTRYPLYRRLGGPQGRSGKCGNCCLPTGIQCPEHPARSQWLYRLRYPAPEICRSAYDILTYLVTYLLIPWSRVQLEKLTSFQLVKKFPAFYWTRSLITAVTSVRHLSQSWASSIQSIPPTSHFLNIHLPSSIISFLLLRSYQNISPGPRQEFMFRNKANFYGEKLLPPLPNPQAGGPPLVGCLRLLTQYIRSYPPYWRPFLHP